MRTEVFQSRSANCIAVLPGNHECRELDDVGRAQLVGSKHGDNVGEDLVGLLGHCGWCGSIRTNAQLAGDEEQLGALGYRDGMTIEPQRSMDGGWICEAQGHRWNSTVSH